MLNIKVVVFIGGRANHGRLYSLIKKFKTDKVFDVNILGAGTYNKVKKEKFMQEDFYIDGDMFKDSMYNKANTIALIAMNSTAYLINNKFDYAIVHGDRYESLGFAIAANSCNIPLVHMEAGELSFIDNDIRWAITALSQYLMCPTEVSFKRMYYKNESEAVIKFVGSTIVELIRDIKFKNIVRNNVLITYNPVDEKETEKFCNIISSVLEKYPYNIHGVNFIWVNPNIDPGNKHIVKLIKKIQENFKELQFIKDVEMFEYLNLIKSSICMVGNSSAGIKEAYLLGIHYLLYGKRQGSRETFKNCERCMSMKTCKEKLSEYIYYKDQLVDCEYEGELGDGETSTLVIDCLKEGML